MSRRNKGPRIPDFTSPPPAVVFAANGDSISIPTDGAAFAEVFKPKPAPYYTEEKTFTTRQGGPDAATLMGEYINRYAIGTGASLLMVHPIPANNSFLFIWENP